MEATKKAALIEAGINFDDALPRFMDREAMLEKYLIRFLTEKSFPDLEKAMASHDQENAVMAAHTHKSVSGAIGCDALHKMLVEQEALLRAGDWDKAAAMMDSIVSEHARVCKAIRENLAQE